MYLLATNVSLFTVNKRLSVVSIVCRVSTSGSLCSNIIPNYLKQHLIEFMMTQFPTERTPGKSLEIHTSSSSIRVNPIPFTA